LARSGILLEFWTSGDPMGVAQGKVPGGCRGESRGGVPKGKVQAQISPRGRASTVSLDKY